MTISAISRLLAGGSMIAVVSIASGPKPHFSLPQGYIVVPSSISPDGRYGIKAFDNSVYPIPLSGEIDYNQLVDLHTGHTFGPVLGWKAMIQMNRGGIQPTRWSMDESLLLWEVEGRWSPDALTLVHVKDSKITSQMDLLKVAQEAIIKRTRAAEPAR